MKKFLFFILMAGLTLSSCSKKDENPLVGKWTTDHVNILFKLNGINKSLQQEAITSPGAVALLSMVQLMTMGQVIEFTENQVLIGGYLVDYTAENGIIYNVMGGRHDPLFKYKFEGELLVITSVADENIDMEEIVNALENIFGPGVSDVEPIMYLKKI